jgi:uncharacterized protein YpmS
VVQQEGNVQEEVKEITVQEVELPAESEVQVMKAEQEKEAV